MVRLFNKLLLMVVGVVTATLFAACSDDNELVRLENGLYKSDTHPYGMCHLSGPTICGTPWFITEGILSFDKNANSYVLTPKVISDMPVEKLKPFASTPILLPNEIVEKLDTTQNVVTVTYYEHAITSNIINQRTYQNVIFVLEDNITSESRSSERMEECATPDSCILSPAPDFLLSRSSDSSPIFVI